MDTVDWRIAHGLIEETDLGEVDVWRESLPIHSLVRSLMMMRSLRREIHSMIKKTSMKSRMRVINHLLWRWQFVDRQCWRLEQTGFQIDNHTVFEEGERHPFQIVFYLEIGKFLWIQCCFHFSNQSEIGKQVMIQMSSVSVQYRQSCHIEHRCMECPHWQPVQTSHRGVGRV